MYSTDMVALPFFVLSRRLAMGMKDIREHQGGMPPGYVAGASHSFIPLYSTKRVLPTLTLNPKEFGKGGDAQVWLT
ncbi:uncharacterized protein EV422DRAFT_428895 [Fimicolochytrium jonesii]|uniref:uncharacterized protein n=1 Tax=Fimicolochytrium jonesii TaxID=1396493 RepID=UPI0022FE7A4E|nr:uncharacterized protein EV422DRAFT_428895 [Fimicolochytrium jonesii]KAI8821708.1 hypothetical protein EV422DRAFT_428895 [Fimicolochytrium jonesii]